MYDYTFLGGDVNTPLGPGRYLEHTSSGTVIVVLDYDTPPTELDGDKVFIVGGANYEPLSNTTVPVQG